MSMLSRVWLFATPCTVACQAPLSMEFSRQEHWSRLPFPPLRDLLGPGSVLHLLHWQADSLPLCHLGSPYNDYEWIISCKNCESLYCTPVTYFILRRILLFKKNFFKWPKIGPESSVVLLYFFVGLKKRRRDIEKMTWMTKRDGLLHSSSSTLNGRDPDAQTEQPWLLNKDKNYFQKKHLHHRCLV